MCGFAGLLVSHENMLTAPLRQSFDLATEKLKHRGDTETRSLSGPGSLSSSLAGRDLYWLTHHRLAFQDLHLGQQPMLDSSGKWLIVFNGEIYNHLELRRTLTGLRNHTFRTRSDTETLLEGFLAIGPSFFDHLDGEYAFVILSLEGNSLIAHRDPSGVKPLFLSLDGVETDLFAEAKLEYRFRSQALGFASEMKGLAHQKKWHTTGLLRQFVGLYEPIRTPFQNIVALAPGSLLIAEKRESNESASFDCASFNCVMSLPRQGVRALPERRALTDDRLPLPCDAFLEALENSVEERLLSDVELGVYLSGGVDSRAVAAILARSEKSSRVGRHAFTVGFESKGFDETNDALDFAKTCGFTSHALRLRDQDLAYSYAFAVQASENIQPYTNGAAKWWLSRFTRQHVNGVLTGDGSDELLCGYPSYRYVKWWMHAMRARQNDISNLKNIPLGTLPRDELYAHAFADHARNPWISGSSASGHGLDFVESLASWGVAHPLYGQIAAIAAVLLGSQASAWLESQGSSVRSWFLAGYADDTDATDPRLALTLWQNYFFRTHLPVQVLNWVGDRMEMANTLEGRTPFLSRRMRDLVQHLPDHALVNGFADKFILRQSLRSIMPERFVGQPKKQFGAPFLDGDKNPDQIEAAFHATGLEGSAIATRVASEFHRLKKIINLSQNAGRSADEVNANSTDNPIQIDARFELTHLNQLMQTTASLAIVQKTLVEGNQLQRDFDYESSILAREQILPPAN
jgi:asparagine synthase (glutamine-hydrolysing)